MQIQNSFLRTRMRLQIAVAGAALSAAMLPTLAYTQSAWNPTLLVNTESFQTIDEGDGTTDIEIRFGQTLDERIYWDRAAERFRITNDLSVDGTLSGSALNIDTNATIWGNLTVGGTATFQDTVNATGNISTQADLTASGSIRTDGGLTINSDESDDDATLTFGNQTGNQTLQFIHATQSFQFSTDLRVQGAISGSTLNIDGDVTFNGVTYSFPDGQGSENTFLRNDGSGNLTWTETAVGSGSGGIVSMHPEYPNAVYFSSGSAIVGQLSYAFDASNNQNYYRWTSSKGDIQDYWIAVRVRVPANFDSWNAVRPIEFRYRTGAGASGTNHLTVRMLDTAGDPVTLTSAANLANTSWTTANITGPQSGGTYTPNGYITVFIKLAATSSGSADAGFLNFNWITTTP